MQQLNHSRVCLGTADLSGLTVFQQGRSPPDVPIILKSQFSLIYYSLAYISSGICLVTLSSRVFFCFFYFRVQKCFSVQVSADAMDRALQNTLRSPVKVPLSNLQPAISYSSIKKSGIYSNSTSLSYKQLLCHHKWHHFSTFMSPLNLAVQK